MENNLINSTNDFNKNNTSKSRNPLVLPLILASVLALAGIGFGVFEYIDNSKKSSELLNLKNLKTEETTEDNKTTTTIADSNKEGINSEKYFYFDEWGIKVKLNDGYKINAYQYSSEAENPGSTQGSYNFWAGGYCVENSDYCLSVYPSTEPLTLEVRRYLKSIYDLKESFPSEYFWGDSKVVFEDEEYIYIAQHMNGIYLDRENQSEVDQTLTDSAYDFCKNSGFINPDNYSKI